MCSACSSSRCGKFTVKPACALLMMKQFGKPRLCMPCSVRTPSAHFSVSVTPSRPYDLVARRGACSRCRPRSRSRRSGSRARTRRRRRRRPSSVIRSTPWPSVSTSVTFGRLKVCEVLVVEARALAELAVVGLERLGGARVVDDRVDARADLLHLLEVGELHRRARCPPGVRSASRRCGMPIRSLPMMSVQPSFDEVLGLRAARDEVVEVVHPLLLPARARATAAHSGSVGRLSRTSIDDGVRWNT